MEWRQGCRPLLITLLEFRFFQGRLKYINYSMQGIYLAAYPRPPKTLYSRSSFFRDGIGRGGASSALQKAFQRSGSKAKWTWSALVRGSTRGDHLAHFQTLAGCLRRLRTSSSKYSNEFSSRSRPCSVSSQATSAYAE